MLIRTDGDRPHDPWLPRRGENHVRRRLERHLPALRLTRDEWMLRLYGEDPPPSEFQACFERVSERIAAVWTRCAELGLDVVLDLGFWSRGQRDQVRATAAALGAETRLYRLSCPDDAAWTRIERRNRDLTDSLFIARETFLLLKELFEPLDGGEPRVEVPG